MPLDLLFSGAPALWYVVLALLTGGVAGAALYRQGWLTGWDRRGARDSVINHVENDMGEKFQRSNPPATDLHGRAVGGSEVALPRWFMWLGAAFFATFIALLLWSLAVQLWPVQPVDMIGVGTESFVVQNAGKEVRQGEFLTVNLHYVKNGNYPATVATTVVCGATADFPGYLFTVKSVESNVPKREFSGLIKLALITEAIPAGSVCYAARAVSYRIFAGREKNYVWETDDFTVLPALKK